MRVMAIGAEHPGRYEPANLKGDRYVRPRRVQSAKTGLKPDRGRSILSDGSTLVMFQR